MKQEIQELIAKNLPAQVGEVLKKRLEDADKYEVLVKAQKEMLNDKDGEIKCLKAEIEKYMKFDTRNSELDQREREISKRENTMEVWEAKLKLAEAEKRISDNVNFVGMVFKSPVFRKYTNEYDNYQNTYVAGQEKRERTGGNRSTDISVD